MFRIKIKTSKDQQSSHSYDNAGYDDYGEWVGHGGPQIGQEISVDHSECCICGGEISGSHLVFTLKSSEHEVHTSCLITSMALISNGVALIAGFFKRKKNRRRQIEEGGQWQS